MNSYTPKNPPKKGLPKRIWRSLLKAGVKIHELHYNANCWGNQMTDGWGTWAGDFTIPVKYKIKTEMENYEAFLRIQNSVVYLQSTSAPFYAVPVALLDHRRFKEFDQMVEGSTDQQILDNIKGSSGHESWKDHVERLKFVAYRRGLHVEG